MPSNPAYLKEWLPFSRMETESPANQDNLLYLMSTGQRLIERFQKDWHSGDLAIEWQANSLEIWIFYKRERLLGYDWTSPKFYFQAQLDGKVAEATEALKRAMILEDLADV